MSPPNNRYFLRLAISCRKLTAQVTNTTTDSIVSMASSTEQEFVPYYRSKLNTFPRAYRFYDANIASRVGEKLGVRLTDIGISHVEINVSELSSIPTHHRKMIVPLLDSVKSAGVSVSGLDKLEDKLN